MDEEMTLKIKRAEYLRIKVPGDRDTEMRVTFADIEGVRCAEVRYWKTVPVGIGTRETKDVPSSGIIINMDDLTPILSALTRIKNDHGTGV